MRKLLISMLGVMASMELSGNEYKKTILVDDKPLPLPPPRLTKEERLPLFYEHLRKHNSKLETNKKATYFVFYDLAILAFNKKSAFKKLNGMIRLFELDIPISINHKFKPR